MRHYSDKIFFALCLVTIFLMTIPFSAQAAVVVLKNGDRITGRIVKMEKQRLEIDPPFSDIIKIKWEDVQSIWQFPNRGNIPHFSWSCADKADWSVSVRVQRAVLPFEGQASTLEPSSGETPPHIAESRIG